MKWFLDLNIGTKLISAFVFVSLIGAFIGYEGISSLNEADKSDTILYERNTVPLAQIGIIKASFQRMRCNMLEIAIAKSESEKNGFLDKITARREKKSPKQLQYWKKV